MNRMFEKDVRIILSRDTLIDKMQKLRQVVMH